MTEENGGGKVAKNKSTRNKFKNPGWKEKQKLKAEQVKEILEQKLKKNEQKVDKKKEILQKKKSKKAQKKEKLKVCCLKLLLTLFDQVPISCPLKKNFDPIRLFL